MAKRGERRVLAGRENGGRAFAAATRPLWHAAKQSALHWPGARLLEWYGGAGTLTVYGSLAWRRRGP